MRKTFKFRLKSKNTKHLSRMSNAINFVWNYCNDVSAQYLDKKGKWLSGFDLNRLTSKCTKELEITGETVQSIGEQFASNRFFHKKRILSWRSDKRNLGWIPFKVSVSLKNGVVKYNKIKFNTWLSRSIEGKIKSGSFSQDAKGNWYVCLVCDVPNIPVIKSGGEIGIDLGVKTIATLSTGEHLNRENLVKKYAKKLATAQRANKKRQFKSIHTKIKNSRNDWNHKVTTKIINNNDKIFVGDVSSAKLKKTKLAKSVSDAGWFDFKSMLAYKAIALGVEYKEVKENFSTVTCSCCFAKSGPSGLSALGVREWTCKVCGIIHDRDVNAAKNILRFGHESLIKGTQTMGGAKKSITITPSMNSNP